MNCPECGMELEETALGPVCINANCEVFDDYKEHEEPQEKEE